MKVCVIGAGVSGLSAAYYLAGLEDTDVSVYEKAAVPGGRANVLSEAEHCARLFLSDYDYLFGILKAIEEPGGGSIFDGLRTLRRYAPARNSGWLEISHMYSAFAREVTIRDKLRASRMRRSSPLLADQYLGKNTNRYGSLSNYSLPSLARMARNLPKSRIAYALEGPTDTSLIYPWIHHLAARGVRVETNADVLRIASGPDGASVYLADRVDRFDAVVVTAFLSDAAALLSASGFRHTLRNLNHFHCRCFTIALHPDEKVLSSPEPAMYYHNGLGIVVQPRHDRCVVLCTNCPSTEAGYVLDRVSEYLDLSHEVVAFWIRDNQRPEEAIFAADYVSPASVLTMDRAHLYFAGSYIRNSYPIDSGEGATRTAFNAVAQIQRDYGLHRRADGSPIPRIA